MTEKLPIKKTEGIRIAEKFFGTIVDAFSEYVKTGGTKMVTISTEELDEEERNLLLRKRILSYIDTDGTPVVNPEKVNEFFAYLEARSNKKNNYYFPEVIDAKYTIKEIK